MVTQKYWGFQLVRFLTIYESWSIFKDSWENYMSALSHVYRDDKFWIHRKVSPAPIIFFEIKDRQKTDKPTNNTYLLSLLAEDYKA